MTKRDKTAVLLVGALWAAAYLPPLLAGRVLPARDLAATQAPWRAVWRDQVVSGHLPLWDPYSNQGRPLLANPNAMAGYPGTLLCLVMSPESAITWHLASHHLLLLLACFLIARRSGAPSGAAVVAAAATASAGIAWSLVTLVNSQASLAWAALAVAAAVPPPHRATAARRALVSGAALGLSFLGGEPVIAGLGALAWTTVVATLWRPRPLAGLAIAAGAAVGVAAPVLLPLLAIYPDTSRATLGVAPGALAADTLAPRRWVELLLPRVLGHPLADGPGGFWAATSFPWQRYFPLVFVGVLPVLTVPFARRFRSGLSPWWLLAGFGVGGSLLLGWPAAAAFAARLPGGTSVRFGVKLLLLAFLALPPLVAAGLERLQRDPALRRRVAAAALAVAVALATGGGLAPKAVRDALARLYPSSRAALSEVKPSTLRRDIVRDAAALALPSLTLLATSAAAPLAAAVLVSNYSSGKAVLVFDDASRWTTPPQLAVETGAGATVAAFATAAVPAASGGEPALERFQRSRAALVPEYGTRWGISYTLTRGPDGLEPVGQDLVAAETAHLEPAARTRVARALGASAVIDERPVSGFAARSVAGVWLTPLVHDPPQAYLVGRELAAQGIPAVVRTLAAEEFRPGTDAVVDGIGGARTLATGVIVGAGGTPGSRRYTVTSEGPGLLVVRQSTMRCWKARIDGSLTPIVPVNGAQIGIRVPAGTHQVEVYVDPRPAYLGVLGPLLVAIGFFVATRRAAASPGHPDATGDAARSIPATPPAR